MRSCDRLPAISLFKAYDQTTTQSVITADRPRFDCSMVHHCTALYVPDLALTGTT